MTEGERIIRLETQMNNIEKKVDEGFENVLKRLDSLDEKYASKWVEVALSRIGWVVILAVVSALLALVIIK